MTSKCDIGFVGAGGVARALGRLAVSAGLRPCFYDIEPGKAGEAASEIGGVAVGSLEDLASLSRRIAVTVPGNVAASVLEELFSMPEVRGSLVFDTSTFKRGVVGVMSSAPEGVRVAMVHPLFGPLASRANAHYAVVCPVPGKEEGAAEAIALLANMGLNVMVMEWRDHDRLVSLSIGLTYIISEAIGILVEKEGLDTASLLPGTTYRYLSVLVDSILSDPLSLRDEILGYPDVVEVIRKLRDALADVINGRRSKLKGSKDAYLKLYHCLEECSQGAEDKPS